MKGSTIDHLMIGVLGQVVTTRTSVGTTETLALGGPKQRGVLALLTASRPHPVTADYFDNGGELACTNTDAPCGAPQPYLDFRLEHDNSLGWLITGIPSEQGEMELTPAQDRPTALGPICRLDRTRSPKQRSELAFGQ